MEILPCDTCLKYPLCISKKLIRCKAIIRWLTKYDWKSESEIKMFNDRLDKFESLYKRCLAIITNTTLKFYLTQKTNNSQVAILEENPKRMYYVIDRGFINHKEIINERKET